MSKFYQYLKVILSNGTHEFSYNIFVPCASEHGLTDEEIQAFLQDRHDMRDEPDSDGLKEGMYWTNSDTSCGAYPASRFGVFSNPIVYKLPDIGLMQLMEDAPELFYIA